jgi:hypothetical protein
MHDGRIQEDGFNEWTADMATTNKTRIRSANIQAGIDYEVRRERINKKIGDKIAAIRADNGRMPNEVEMQELRSLAASR